MTQEQSSTTNKPIEGVRFGSVIASIWRNVTEAGHVRFSARLERVYTDSKGDRKYTRSFGRDDLLVVAKVANQAHTRIQELINIERDQAKAAAAAAETDHADGRTAAASGYGR